MLNQAKIESLAKRITELIPADIKPISDDVENSVRNLLQSTLSRMQLVTREEFDVQSQLLQRTREKLDKLEKELAELQNK